MKFTKGLKAGIFPVHGDEDLEEFFVSPLNYPPNLDSETIQYWNSLANVAEALDAMHNLELERENRRHDCYSEFRVCQVQAKESGKNPKQDITGETEIYGAPECDLARLDPSINVP
ncbi:hypothetical protein F5Y05DRAFT_409208 [Hypoxylon sp. FL0543]|nr:hypothetical protein F5Y05DRAFT_409208 [Hypoxylon sp. FL0543]